MASPTEVVTEPKDAAGVSVEEAWGSCRCRCDVVRARSNARQFSTTCAGRYFSLAASIFSFSTSQAKGSTNDTAIEPKPNCRT